MLYALMLVASVLIVVGAAEFSWSARHFPYAVAAALATLAVVNAVLDVVRGARGGGGVGRWRRGGTRALAGRGTLEADALVTRDAVVAMGLVGALAVLVLVAGFTGASPIFGGYYVRAWGRASIAGTALTVVGILATLVVFQNVFSSVGLYEGLLFGGHVPRW
jgi:hypothetical protein